MLKWRKTAVKMFKSRVGFISFIIFVLKTYFDFVIIIPSSLFFSGCAHEKAEMFSGFHEDSENKTTIAFSLIFAGFYCSHGDISVKTL